MDFNLSDSTGMDGDLPPSNQTQSKFRSRGPFHQMQNDMEVHIHSIELEAYCSVLRAFKAQSDAITWEKESLITELRKELRVTDYEHSKLLAKVNSDDKIGKIREWRKMNRLQSGTVSCPTTSASYKKQKTSQSGASLSVGPPSLALHQPVQPSSSDLKRALGPDPRADRIESYASTGFTDKNHFSIEGRGSAFTTKELDPDNSFAPLIGRNVWTRWPEDNNFYEAIIRDFNPIEGRHALVYDAGTPNESWEWVNLREISPNDICWKRKDVGISHKGSQSGLGHEIRKSTACGEATAGSVRRNGIDKKAFNHIEILHTDTLVTEVDKLFSSSHADPMDIEKARKLLKEHEQALIDAIAKLEGISDGESDREHRYQWSQLQMAYGIKVVT